MLKEECWSENQTLNECMKSKDVYIIVDIYNKMRQC